MRELEALVERGYFFQPVYDHAGEILVLVGSKGYLGFYDHIHIWDEHEAIAARENGKDIVWSYEGTTVDTALALLHLPGPDQPGAPRLARPKPTGLWLPKSE